MYVCVSLDVYVLQFVTHKTISLELFLVWFDFRFVFVSFFFNLFIAFNTFHRCSTRAACRNWVSILCMLYQVRRMCEQ